MTVMTQARDAAAEALRNAPVLTAESAAAVSGLLWDGAGQDGQAEAA